MYMDIHRIVAISVFNYRLTEPPAGMPVISYIFTERLACLLSTIGLQKDRHVCNQLYIYRKTGTSVVSYTFLKGWHVCK